MSDNYRFFKNTKCYYFPCHPVEDEENFNCLFCYCPLYFFADCGGRPVMLGRVKDCSNCDRPHRPGGYEQIISRLARYFEETENGQKNDAGAPEGTNDQGVFYLGLH
ncbi:MAG: cysteine-rich small domain-containing protein [Desulfobaccales bacterium]